MTFVLTIIMILAGEPQPKSLNVPMSDLDTCEHEAHRFLTLVQPPDKPQVLMRAAGCRIDTPEVLSTDVKK